jgi:lipooligosaccharide transport system ATP-binding protein
MDEGRIVCAGSPQQLIKETVPPHVVEVRLGDTGWSESGEAARGLPDAAKPLAALADRTEVRPDKLLFYTGEAERLIGLAAHHMPEHTALLHRTTLEDVFLTITGRSLDE